MLRTAWSNRSLLRLDCFDRDEILVFALNSLRYSTQARRHGEDRVPIRASLHRTEIGMLERGISLPRIDTLIRPAGAIEVGVAELARRRNVVVTDDSVGRAVSHGLRS